MVKVDTVKLATGAELPLLGLGTWLSNDPSGLEAALRVALDAGYPLIDTAYAYGNEAVIGKVLHEYITSGKLKREKIFITTKLFFACHRPEVAEKVLVQQLKDLKLDYIDLCLIHCPCPMKHRPNDTLETRFGPLIENGLMVPDLVNHVDTWRILEKFYKEGKLKAIGLSNFNQEQIQNVIDHATVKPHNLQVECHIYWPQFELYEFCKKNNITFTAYGPIGSPGRKAFASTTNWPEGEPMKDPKVVELAKKYHKTPAQILLRHMTQRGISAIPKSTNPERIKENINIFDFKLTNDEVKALNCMGTRIRLFVLDVFANHPWYPFKDVDVKKLNPVDMKSI